MFALSNFIEMRKLFIITLIALLPFAGICQGELKVNVHPGVELFTIIQILGDKYPQPNPSAYSKEMSDYFGKYKDHPAVKKVISFGRGLPSLFNRRKLHFIINIHNSFRNIIQLFLDHALAQGAKLVGK
jgi:hypothetical protein